jgi:hypothetical protein
VILIAVLRSPKPSSLRWPSLPLIFAKNRPHNKLFKHEKIVITRLAGGGSEDYMKIGWDGDLVLAKIIKIIPYLGSLAVS